MGYGLVSWWHQDFLLFRYRLQRGRIYSSFQAMATPRSDDILSVIDMGISQLDLEKLSLLSQSFVWSLRDG